MAVARQYVEKDFYTEEEYVTWEEDAIEKSEYIDGEIRAMSGGSEPHASIPMNIGGELRTALRGRGCRVLSSDMKVWAAGVYYYPDLSVVCGPSIYRGRNKHTITNPLVVVEVLSPSTESEDRGEKFIRYQQIETLRSYLLVGQTEPRVELFERGGKRPLGLHDGCRLGEYDCRAVSRYHPGAFGDIRPSGFLGCTR